MTIYNYQWLSMTINNYLWLYMASIDYLLLFMNIQDYPWVDKIFSLYLHGSRLPSSITSPHVIQLHQNKTNLWAIRVINHFSLASCHEKTKKFLQNLRLLDNYPLSDQAIYQTFHSRKQSDSWHEPSKQQSLTFLNDYKPQSLTLLFYHTPWLSFKILSHATWFS